MKVGKALLAWLLTFCLLIVPFNGLFVYAADTPSPQTDSVAPTVKFNIDAFDAVLADTIITVDCAAKGDATLASCSVRLEGTEIGTTASVSFKPSDYELSNGLYTIVAEATDSLGVTAIQTVSFYLTDKIDIGFTYAEDESIVPNDPNATAAYHKVEPLNYTVGYGSSTDGTISIDDTTSFKDADIYGLQYMNNALNSQSVAGLPYHMFNVALNGKTDGEVVVRYTGSTISGERIALKVYNPTTNNWDSLGVFYGSDSVSSAVSVATYAVDDTIRVAAILDYATNGSNTMIWSTDPQHYTKFADLNDFYYQVYQYAAEQYLNGNAGYIITTGDLVDDRPTSSAAAGQWQVADKAMSYVDDVNMPNGLVSGNHDVCDFKKPDYSAGPNTAADYSKFHDTFPVTRYNNKQWFGGSINNNISHYDLVTIGNVDFIVMYLGYGLEATDETIQWANDVLQMYSHRVAIITTHQYLDAGAAVRDDTSRAQLIFDKIVDPNPNVRAVLCGHDDGSLCLEKTTSQGVKVYEILSDYQFVEAEPDDFYENSHYIGNVPECCGDGYIRLMSVSGNYLSSITYSPVTDRYNPYGDRESFTINLGDTTPTRYIDSIAFSAYVLGEETADTVSNATAIVITNGNSTTYHHVSYADYPEMPNDTDEVLPSIDYAPLQKLITTAESIDTADKTADTVTALTDAIAAAKTANDDADVKAAYLSLANAIGALEDVQEVIDDTNLVSIHNYDLDASKWYSNDSGTPITSTASHITVTATEKGGMHMSRSPSSTNTWPSARYSATSSITVKPNNGKIYAKLDVVADSAWCIYLEVSQGNNSAAVRLNFAIANAFNRIDTDGYQGTYQGVYDVTKAFEANGIDPNCTMTIKRSLLYIVPGDVTYDYFELLTDPSTGEIDTTELDALLASVEALNASDYTTTTWKNLQKQVTAAKTVLDNADSSQSDVNLAAKNVQTYIDKLKKNNTIVEEPEGSLLPADEGQWKENVAGTMNIYRDANKYTVLQNTNSQWPFADYNLPIAYYTTVADHQLSVDITVGSASHPYLMINNTWVSLSKYISAANTDPGSNDLGAGTYTVDIPLSSITELADQETASITVVRVYAVGPAESSAVTIRKLMITDYVAPPPVEKEQLDLIPETTEDITIVAGDGTVSVENGAIKVTNNGDGDLRISYKVDDLYDLTVLNALHLAIDSEIPFKIALHVMSYNDGSGAWVNTSGNYSSIFTIENDRVIPGNYDKYLELRNNCGSITDKTSVYHNQVIILMTGKGSLNLKTFEAIAYDTYEWDDDMTTYGPAATPDNPYYQHAAKTAPKVEHKVDLLSAIGLGEHPTVTGWASYGNQALNLNIDISKTPYLYYSFAQPADSNFTFSLYSNSNYSPWLMFRDATGEGAYLNQGAANWDSYTNREQYTTTSETGCIDMRQYLKNPAVLKWVVNQITFYNSQGKNVVISYMFFGSEPILEDVPGDMDENGSLDITDVSAMYQYISGALPMEEVDAAKLDVTGDGKINMFDIQKLYLIVSGKKAA